MSMPTSENNTKLWYLAPIFLGIIGGLVMYLVLKDTNPKMAKKGLVVSIAIVLAVVIGYFAIIAIAVGISATF
jgi:predicted PurR-regulated permease PerM